MIMTNGESVKDMTSKFNKLVKFEGQDFRRWQKKMHFLLTTLKVVYVLSTPSPVWSENETLETTRKRMKWKNDDYICRGHILSGMSDSLFDIYQNVESAKALWVSLESKYMAEDASATNFLYTQHNLMMDEAISVAVIIDKLSPSWKEFKHDNVLYVHGIQKNLVSEIVLNKCGYKQVLESDNHSNSLSKSELWHARLGHVHYNRMRDMSKMSLIPAFDMTHESCKTCILTKITRQPFKGVNRESKVLDRIHSDLCDFHANPGLGHNKGGEYYDPVYFQSTGIIHQTTAPYTPQQNGVAEKKNRTLKEMVNFMLSYSRLSEGFWGEAMLTACYILNRTPNKNSKQTPYEIWTKKVPNLTYLRIWGCRAVVRLTEPKMKNLGEKGKIAEDEVEGTDDVPGPSVPRTSTRTRKAKSFGSDFQLYLVEGTRDKTLSQREYRFIIKDNPGTLSEAMDSRDAAFWKEAVQSKIDSIMHNDT
nr:hypothetical protein [Tanacetum cinerariifolium]